MKFVILLIIHILWALCAFSQNNGPAVSGKVLDEDTCLPLFGATVGLIQQKDSTPVSISALIDNKGLFVLSSLSAGAYLIHISFIGYSNRLMSLIITPGNGGHFIRRYPVESRYWSISDRNYSNQTFDGVEERYS